MIRSTGCVDAPGLSVVVMAFNEAANLEPVVAEITSALLRIGRVFELLIIDDGSTDGTGGIADALAACVPGVRVIHHDVNRGLGGVYRTGFAEARGALVTFFPADGQFPASIIEEFVPMMNDQELVLGYLPNRERGFVGRALSAAEKLVYRLVAGPMPRFQGIFMFRRTVLDEIDLLSAGRGWTVVLEFNIRVARQGRAIRSVPIPIRPRLSGVSKVQNLPTILANLKQAIALRRLLRHCPEHTRARARAAAETSIR